MVVVICCHHRAQALSGSLFLCKHTWEHVLLKQKKMMMLVLNISSNGILCSIQDGGSLVCGVFGHRDLTQYFITLAHKKTAQGIWRVIVVQYLEDWGNLSEQALRD